MSRTAGAVAAAAAALLAVQAAAETRIADIREGTNLTLALAPGGDSIVMTLLGGLWRLPASGGAATELTPNGHGADHPRFDPAGRRVVYERFVDGQFDLWVLDTNSGEDRPLTRTPYDERHPDFMPDGETVVYAANRTGRFRLWRLRAGGGTPEPVSNVPGEQSFPSVSDQGDIAYVNRSGATWSLRAIAASGADFELLSGSAPLAAPSWRPGGGVLLFTELAERGPAARLSMIVLSDRRVVRTLVAEEDVFLGRPAWTGPDAYLYAADGRIWRRGIAALERDAVSMFAAAQVETVEAPVARVPADAPGPHAAVGFGRPTYSPGRDFGIAGALGDLWRFDADGAERLTDDAFVELDPAVLSDAGSVVYASDRGGGMDLWQLALEDGRARQLTFGPGKAFSPAPGPAGRYVAYLSTDGFDRSAEAELRILPLQAQSAPRTLAAGLLDAGELAWSSAGGEPVVTLRARIAAGSDASRLLAFGLDGRRVEQAAAPAVLDGTSAATGPELPALEWQPPDAGERYVVQVGRLFDGIRAGYERHLDIHVRDGRIEAIAARGTRALPERVIDLRDATVIPGLIDTHAHQSDLLGERLGRAWLAFGVTTVREITDDVGAAVARAEAWEAGRRSGPRLVVAPAVGAAAAPRALETGSPIRVDRSGTLTQSLAHPHASAGPGALPALATGAASGLERAAGPVLPVSALGRTYQDAESAVLASGRYVATGLAALAGASPTALEPTGALAALWNDAERRAWAAPGAGAAMLAEPLTDTIARLVQRGARIGVGSDAPLTPYGLGLHAELERLESAGIPRDQVLRLATAQAALALGLDRDLGTLEAGKLADFVVVDGDPLARIGDARRIRAVVRGGIWHERRALLDGVD